MISEAAQAGMARAGRVAGSAGAHRIEVEFDAAHLAAAAAVVPTVDLLDVRRIGFDAASMTDAMKAFKVVTAIASGAVEGSYG
jgi:D-amino peptidase